jgi:DNA-binding response OmpR family regulator
MTSTRAIREFESSNKLPRCRIVALTGLASASARLEALSSGVDYFMTKPMNFKALESLLQKGDEKKRKQSESQITKGGETVEEATHRTQIEQSGNMKENPQRETGGMKGATPRMNVEHPGSTQDDSQRQVREAEEPAHVRHMEQLEHIRGTRQRDIAGMEGPTPGMNLEHLEHAQENPQHRAQKAEESAHVKEIGQSKHTQGYLPFRLKEAEEPKQARQIEKTEYAQEVPRQGVKEAEYIHMEQIEHVQGGTRQGADNSEQPLSAQQVKLHQEVDESVSQES